jgi:hypothetical protein
VTTRFQQHLCLTCIDDDALSSWLPSFFLATVYLSASDYNSWTRWLFLSVPWNLYLYILAEIKFSLCFDSDKFYRSCWD